MRHALLLPDRYFAVGSFSGALDADMFSGHEMLGGRKFKNTDDDLLYLLKKSFSEGIELPRLYQHVGTQDFLYDANQRFRDLLKDLRIPSTYVEDDGGHSWKNWDEQVKNFIEWALV